MASSVAAPLRDQEFGARCGGNSGGGRRVPPGDPKVTGVRAPERVRRQRSRGFTTRATPKAQPANAMTAAMRPGGEVNDEFTSLGRHRIDVGQANR